MTPLEELATLFAERGRRIVVAERPVDLRTLNGENFVYVLQLPEGSLAAAGRAGGFGERTVEKLYAFHYQDGSCRKLFETDDREKLERFELPYHAAGTLVILPDGSERIVSGVIDPDFVGAYKRIA